MDQESVEATVQKIPLSANKDAARQMLAELVRKVELAKVGIHDPFEAHRKKKLSDHLADWKASLRANRRSEEYIAVKVSRVQSIVAGCGWTFPTDMTVDRLETYLAELRDSKPTLPSLVDGQNEFTAGEVAALLNVTRSAIPSLIRRHRLPASGNGKARRFPIHEPVSGVLPSKLEWPTPPGGST